MKTRGDILKVIVDRFEGEFAVVEMEDKTMVNMPKCLIPESREGDVIIIKIDEEETANRKKRMKDMMRNLWE